MANNQGHLTALATPDIIAKEAIRQLWNQSEFIKKTYRDYETEFKGKRIGDTVNIRKPQRFITNKGRVLADADYQNLYEGTTSLKIQHQWNVPIQYTTNDKSLTIKDFSNRTLKPAMAQIAADIDAEIALAMKNGFYHSMSDSSFTRKTLSFVDARMNDLGVPKDSRFLVLNNFDGAELSESVIGLRNDSMVKSAAQTGYSQKIANFDPYSSALISRHTVGNHGGTPQLKGAKQNGEKLMIDGCPNSVTGFLKKGDVFTIEGVYAINPATRQNAGFLKHFVVQEDVDTSGSGEAEILISPSINDGEQSVTNSEGQKVSTAAHRNIVSPLADNAPIKISGEAEATYMENLLFHKDSTALAFIDIDLPETAAFKQKATHDGVTVAMVGQWDNNQYTERYRLDVIGGIKVLDGELGFRYRTTKI